MNTLAVVAWFLIRPGNRIGALSPGIVRRRLIAFIIILSVITIGVVLYKFISN
jgi:hypothetical protein